MICFVWSDWFLWENIISLSQRIKVNFGKNRGPNAENDDPIKQLYHNRKTLSEKFLCEETVGWMTTKNLHTILVSAWKSVSLPSVKILAEELILVRRLILSSKFSSFLEGNCSSSKILNKKIFVEVSSFQLTRITNGKLC